MKIPQSIRLGLWGGLFLSQTGFFSSAFAAGFEKSVLWSGHYAALGGAATGHVTGPESLYFNPAGLAASSGIQLSGSFSPTWDRFSAPLTGSSTTIIESNRTFSPVGAALVSYSVTPKLGVGVAYYVSGGARAIYEEVDFSPLNPAFAALKPRLAADVAITEASVGAGYEILDGLRLGLAYRIVLVRGEFDAALSQPVLTQLRLQELSATRYNGFRVGLQYSPKDAPWGVGVDWRTKVEFSATGKSAGSALMAGNVVNLPGSDATVSNTFPQQISVGGFLDIQPSVLRTFLQYTFTQYQDNQSLQVSGTLAGQPIPSFPENWNNMSNLRVGLEYQGLQHWVLRGGYVFTSQVVPNSDPSPTFSSPGTGHTFALGVGTDILPILTMDLALEYSRASGTVTAAESPARAGDYSSNAFAAHLSASLNL